MSRSFALALVCSIAIACATQTRVGEDRLPARFRFPELEPTQELEVLVETRDGVRAPRWKARMVVDGHVTDAMWPEHPPTVYRIAPGQYFLDDNYSGAGDFVWNRAARRLSSIGHTQVHRVLGVGAVPVRATTDAMSPAMEVLDFDPDGRPRVLWSTEGRGGVLVLGHWDGRLVLGRDHESAVVLSPGRPPEEIEVHLRGFRWQAGGDAVRNGKVLVIGDLPVERGGETRPFTVPVGVLDLTTGETTPAGRIHGSWTMTTALPHPVAAARWITKREAEEHAAVWQEVGAGAQLWPWLGAPGWVIEETGEVFSR